MVEDRRRHILSLALILVVSLTFSLFCIHYYRSQDDTAGGESPHETAIERESPDESEETDDQYLFGLKDIDAEVISSLIEELGDEDLDVWKRAEEELIEIGEPAVPLLIDALDSDNTRIRIKTINVLGEIGDPRAVGPIIDLLKSESPLIRARASIALGELKDTKAVKPLIDVLLDDEESWVRSEAAKALGEIGDPRALEPLVQALKDEDPWVRDKARDAMMMIDGIEP